ncbi:cytochrome P450 [Streptomyces gilvus]|uniref:cytochrome P450 n=1 Tax=Streptomyces gilvus TaxID=2920937 RepID=UPI001F0EF47C|nr:cytochrome P450 [Streptomyces sp. CME 23]MCH5675647.1 cytochrome P450 [Streptomyces sp. CME 23]
MTATTLVPGPYPPGLNPPWTEAGHADPVPWFVAMASERPLSYDEQSGSWHFCGHAEVQDFLRSCDLWSTAKRLELVPPEHRVVRLLTSEPPLHAEIRKHFAHAYRPKRIATLEAHVRQVCRDLLDDCLDKGTFDVIADLAAPLTATMIAELLGVPSEANDMLRRVFDDRGPLGRLTQADATDKPALYMGGSAPEEDAALQELFKDLIAQRRREPRGDLISDLAALPAEEFEMRLDVGALLFEQLGAGQNTTTHLLGSFAYLLDRFPEQHRVLRERPDLIRSAIEETVRYSSPLQARPRVTTRAVETGGVSIPEGATGLAWLQAANFDPRQFDDPTRYDVARSPNRHVAFGFGEHYCLGAHLARMEARVVMEELLSRTQWFSRSEDTAVTWVDDFILRGPSRMQIEIVPA